MESPRCTSSGLWGSWPSRSHGQSETGLMSIRNRVSLVSCVLFQHAHLSPDGDLHCERKHTTVSRLMTLHPSCLQETTMTCVVVSMTVGVVALPINLCVLLVAQVNAGTDSNSERQILGFRFSLIINHMMAWTCKQKLIWCFKEQSVYYGFRQESITTVCTLKPNFNHLLIYFQSLPSDFVIMIMSF